MCARLRESRAPGRVAHHRALTDSHRPTLPDKRVWLCSLPVSSRQETRPPGRHSPGGGPFMIRSRSPPSRRLPRRPGWLGFSPSAGSRSPTSGCSWWSSPSSPCCRSTSTCGARVWAALVGGHSCRPGEPAPAGPEGARREWGRQGPGGGRPREAGQPLRAPDGGTVRDPRQECASRGIRSGRLRRSPTKPTAAADALRRAPP